jgi:dihydrofolate reductase
MVKYELIVAMNPDGIIGITDASGNQRLAFTCREDMRHFRDTTTSPEGHILVMGRKTFESLPNSRPLPGRIHIVLSRSPRKYDEKYIIKEDVFFTKLEHLDDVLEPLVYPYSNKRVFVCGGEEIYRALLPRCERLYITHIIRLTRFPLLRQQSKRNLSGESLNAYHFVSGVLHNSTEIELEPGESTSHFSYSETEFEETESKTSANGTCVFRTLERIKSANPL